jgi:hypothetical protein
LRGVVFAGLAVQPYVGESPTTPLIFGGNMDYDKYIKNLLEEGHCDICKATGFILCHCERNREGRRISTPGIGDIYEWKSLHATVNIPLTRQMLKTNFHAYLYGRNTWVEPKSVDLDKVIDHLTLKPGPITLEFSLCPDKAKAK